MGLFDTIGSLFSNGGGAGFQAQPANITNPIQPGQLQTAYDQSQSGLAQQQAFIDALNAQNGIANQSQVYNQLQGVANGTGPNPAQAALNQATGANVANQAALMAGQRGAGANTGMIARQAANQGANIQQQAAGQGATMQAQQQLAAMSAAGNMANQQVGQQANAVGNYNQFAQGNQGQLLGANGQSQGQQVQNQGNVNDVNGRQAGIITKGQQDAIGGLFNAGGAAVKAMMADGGVVGPSSFVGRHFMASGGTVPVMLSPGETYVPPSKLDAKDPIAAGTKVPGTPKVKGNSYANDVVPAKLKEGGVVIPNSVMQSKDPHAAAAKFVAAILSKRGLS